MQTQDSGDIALMPTCASFGSDFGMMLAWSEICQQLTNAPKRTLVVCEDPWLFRHRERLEGISAGERPGLVRRRLALLFRGRLARVRLAIRLLHAFLRLAKTRRAFPRGARVLLVYGHPGSRNDGTDAYFGSLLQQNPDLRRLLHTDAEIGTVQRLTNDSQTTSLHAWGSVLAALRFLVIRWRLVETVDDGQWLWLIRRAAALENGGGGPAMNAWQRHCQHRFLSNTRPHTVCWPWENHGWERAFCRSARALGVRTVGYQHTVVGPHQFNYDVTANHDGLESVPDVVVCNGPAYRDELADWGIPADRLRVLGALRFERSRGNTYDVDGPVFVPLSAMRHAAHVQLAAAKRFADAGYSVLIKEHPMYPVSFAETENLRRTHTPLKDMDAVGLVLFASDASGLDAVLASLPAVRLQTESFISINVLPGFVHVPTATFDTLDKVISDPPVPRNVAREDILSDPDFEGWKALLAGDTKP